MTGVSVTLRGMRATLPDTDLQRLVDVVARGGAERIARRAEVSPTTVRAAARGAVLIAPVRRALVSAIHDEAIAA